MADAQQYSYELNIHDYSKQHMNHSFFMMLLTMMQASSKQARQRFVIPAIVTMHHPHRPPTIISPRSPAWRETSGNTHWSCHGQEKGEVKCYRDLQELQPLGAGGGYNGK